MDRFALDSLKEWHRRPGRKPLILRGARQVGKSYLVRKFAREASLDLLELNLERTPALARLFASNSPAQIVHFLEVHFERDIDPARSLLFLDEVQGAPEVLAALRYFHEEMASLPIVAAGSLLDFALDEPAFTVPVGRIEYLHMGPMGFEEFLRAAGREKLFRFLADYTPGQDVPDVLHAQLMEYLRQFLIVGGMPEVAAAWFEQRSLRSCEAIQQALLAAFRDDFGKYGRHVNQTRICKVFDKLPLLVGKRFRYVQVDRDERSRDLADALQRLCLARVAHRVHHSSSTGVPLGATADDRNFKVLFLDVGLLSSACGLDLSLLAETADLVQVNSGAIAEQFVGQQLLGSLPSHRTPAIHFWSRESRNAQAEVDYVIEVGARVIPVEVKAGKTGTLRSLHVFLREKHLDLGIRLNSEPPSLLPIEVSLPDQSLLRFRLLSLPLYLAGQVRRLAAALLS